MSRDRVVMLGAALFKAGYQGSFTLRVSQAELVALNHEARALVRYSSPHTLYTPGPLNTPVFVQTPAGECCVCEDQSQARARIEGLVRELEKARRALIVDE
jgi:hypothetical protein